MNRRELIIGACALSITGPTVAAMPAAMPVPNWWAELVWLRLQCHGVKILPFDNSFGSQGDRISSRSSGGKILIQRHVDWQEPSDDDYMIDRIGALADNIALNFAAVRFVPLLIPENGFFRAERHSYGDVELRLLSAWYGLEERTITRLDALFCDESRYA